MSALTLFLCLALVLLAIVLAVLTVALTRRPAAEPDQPRAVALSVLRAQYAELAAARRAGALSEERYLERKGELERRVLEETSAAEPQAAAPPPSRLGWYTACILLVLIPVLSFIGYLRFGTPDALDSDFLREVAATGQAHGDNDMRAAVARLEERLRSQPDNLEGWIMLARSYASFRDWRNSSRAYEQVNRLAPGRPELMVDWADVMAADTGSLEGRPREMIEEALRLDPTNWKALSLMGTVYFDQGDYPAAIRYWERLRALFDKGSPEWRGVTDNIDEARRLGGLPPEVNLRQPPPKPGAAAAPGHFLAGTVELAPGLADRARSDDDVYVYALAPGGGRMPVALQRFKVSDLPASFRLDGGPQAELGVRSLNELSEALVEGRVSRSGSFMPGAGDLQGRLGAAPIGSSDLRLVIDQILP